MYSIVDINHWLTVGTFKVYLSYFVFSSPWRWFPEVQNIYYQGNKRKQVPSNQNAKRLESFFNAAAVLMTNQLQMLALSSIDDFTKLFCPPAVSNTCRNLTCKCISIGRSWIKITKVFDKQLRIKGSDIKEWRFDGSMPSFSNSNKTRYVSLLCSERTCEGLSAYD